MKLYDIPLELAALEMELLESGGELTEDLEKRWDEFLALGQDKIEAAAIVVRTIEMEAEACKAESKRLKERADSREKSAERLKMLMTYAVDSLGGRVKTPLFTIWTQTSAPTTSIDVRPETNLEFLEMACPELVRTRREINKEHVKALIATGAEIPDCIVLTDKPGTHYLRIR